MKAMIAAAMIFLSCQAMANSFDNFAQTLNSSEESSEIIIKLKSNVSRMAFGRSVMGSKPLIEDMNLHLLKVNPSMDIDAVLEELRNHPDVAYAQIDHKVYSRITEPENDEIILGPLPAEAGPNDPDFADQWSMGLSENNFGIDALNAWLTYGTGGKDANNNDIVVAVVDGGVEITHQDLQDNVWYNRAEIPNNNIDDDNNGYVDDVNGWNGYTNSNKHQSSSHGTHVAGIIGAKGNNDEGVTGVNWDVKIMNVPGSSGNTSIVLTAYKYILEQKKLWLATNGEFGANIVSTNSSFGIDGADCTSGSYPAWNDIYNEMGKVGILSAAATANSSWNIDQVGDVPTGCDSPYLITVTNNRPDGRRASAGYGKTTIDLAAPGTNILSTYSNGTFRRLTGTSMSTPHVAGAVAFLNSIASQTLSDLYMNDPGAAALEMKRIMMETVTERENFKDETVAGGILNLNAAASEVVNYGMGN